MIFSSNAIKITHLFSPAGKVTSNTIQSTYYQIFRLGLHPNGVFDPLLLLVNTDMKTFCFLLWCCSKFSLLCVFSQVLGGAEQPNLVILGYLYSNTRVLMSEMVKKC